MYNVNGNRIEMIRGDTVYLKVAVQKADGTKYDLQDGDSVVFTVKRDTLTPDALIQKEGLNIVIEPEETSALSYGTYVYDVQLTMSDGKVDTIIPPSPFIVKEEVTW